MKNNQPLDTLQDSTTKQATTKTKRPKSLWLATVLLLILAIVGFSLYGTTRLKLNEEKRAHQNTKSQLAQAQAKLKAAFPELGNSSPECGVGNNDKMRLALINKEPIDGYSFYILNCLNEIDHLTSLKGELQVYKVDANGNLTFKLGNGFGEPYCVSKKFLPLNVAEQLHALSGFPFCSGYYGT